MARDNFFEDFTDAQSFDSVEAFRSALTTTTTTARATARFDSDSVEEYYLVFTPMEEADWFFVSAVPSSVFEIQTRNLLSIAGILLAAVSFALAVAFYFSVRSRQHRTELKEKEATDALNLQLQEKQASLEESLAFTDFFLDQYASVYYVNLKDGSCKVYRRASDLNEMHPIGDNYFTSLKSYISNDVQPDDRAELTEILEPRKLKDMLRSTPAFNRTYRDISSGTERIFRVQVIRGADEDHAALGFEDVTEAYQEQQKRLLGAIPLSSDVLTKANIGLWSFELDEGCAPRMYADEAMLGLIGLDHQIAPEETYHAWYDNIDDGSYDLVNDAVEKMVSGEHAEVQYPWHNPNGETWIVRCGGVRNFDYTKGIRIEGTHQNVSELLHYDDEQRKREEKQRQDELARVQAEAASKSKTEFLFNMSHDIRTPMNAILGYTDIAIRHGDDRSKVDESLGKIKLAGGHLLNLINDILEMSRIESGKLEISEAPMDIRRLIEGVEQMSQSLAIEKSIDFQTEIGDIKNPYVFNDELHANEVLINLISNAVKYTPEGGKVWFRTSQMGEAADGIATYRFEVEDNGIGMSEEYQEHLFEAFTREKTSTVSKQQGAGLGLSIVKKIIDLAGGTISVKSKTGEGSTFTVDIPMRIMDEESIENYEAENTPIDLSNSDFSFENKKVLLVEDNEMNREIASTILEEVGLIVDTAEDGIFAVKAVTEKGVGYYDFVLMDIQMPVMNGYEATKAIRNLPDGDKVTIIALSANAFEEDVQRSLEAGMNAHVAKPIDVKELFDTMQGLINQ
ncbi:MAG: ATP-binding protein [Eubacteriales bacterium]|nr:ATP-binding protein [Eubacteriales bacterium]